MRTRAGGGPHRGLVILSKPHLFADGLAGWAEFARSLNPGGVFEALYVLSVDDDYDYRRLDTGGLTVVAVRRRWLDRAVRFPVQPLYVSLKTAWLGWQLIRRHRLGVVLNVEGNILDNGLPCVWAARLAGVPAIVTLLNDNLQYFRREPFYLRSPRLNALLERHVLRLATHVRCVSPFLTGYAGAHGARAGRVSSLPLRGYTDYLTRTTVDAEAVLARCGLHERVRGRRIVLTPARLTPQKNLLNLLQGVAVARQTHPDLFYILIGGGPLWPQLDAFIQRQGLGPHTAVVGQVPLGELKAFYQVASVLLLASYYEGFPRTVIQAFAFGIPVIGSDRGHFGDIIQEGVNGFTVDPERPEAIAAALSRIFTEPGLLERLRRGAESSASGYADAAIERRERALYERVLEGRDDGAV